MRIAIITAGGAGMYCGSCLHDNSWARGLMAQGQDVLLMPTYTPIRVDEPNASQPRVFLGGINVYLQAKWNWWRKLPRAMTRWVDHPWVISLATRFGVSNDARELGELTLALLQGEDGPHRAQVHELRDFLLQEWRPDVIIFSNALLAGVLPALRRDFTGKIYCLLQGDDIFLQDLPEPYQSQVVGRLQELVRDFDGFLTHSTYYRDFMSPLLSAPADRFHIVPLSIDAHGFAPPELVTPRPFTVGYFARVCPEKGLHLLVDAFGEVQKQIPDARLRAGGYLGKRDSRYFRELQRAARKLGPAFEYVGSPPDHASKVAFYHSIDVLSVPTTYREPKGLPVLEAWAHGVPVVQPRHGAFPELIERTGGGLLFEPGDIAGLSAALIQLGQDSLLRSDLGSRGLAGVREHHDHGVLAQQTIELFSSAPATLITP